jgi:hypothetical protein
MSNSSTNADGASSVYYDFFYKKNQLTYVIPMAAAFFVYYVIYIPYFRRLSYRVRTKLPTQR